MNRILAFSRRNLKELLRDPLSYIFCLGFPLVMLVVMTVVNDGIPPEAGMVIFRIDYLSGGIAVFGLSFIMLFTCLSVSKDRSGSFLVRLYATPMRSADFICGYVLPVLALSVIQLVITFAASLVVSLITDVELSAAALLLAVAALIPSAVMFASLGLLFGTLFSEKSAPGLCSIVISLTSFIGGVFFDPEGTGGVMLTISKCLPFFHATKAARCAAMSDFTDFGLHMAVTCGCAAALMVISSLTFRAKMRADLS